MSVPVGFARFPQRLGTDCLAPTQSCLFDPPLCAGQGIYIKFMSARWYIDLRPHNYSQQQAHKKDGFDRADGRSTKRNVR